MGWTLYGVARRLLILGGLFSVLGLLMPDPAQALAANRAAAEYRLIDLGTLGGARSGAQGLDEDAWVVGWAETGAGERHAFLYGEGNMMDLGPLPGGSDSFATSISSNGRIAGYSGINAYGPAFQEVRQGFIWENGVMRPLGALYCPCDFNNRYGSSEAHAINDQGQVVGLSETVRGQWVSHAFLWQGDDMIDIGGGAGNWSVSRAFDINNVGQVVGDFAADAGRLGPYVQYEHQAFVWEDGEQHLLAALPRHSSSSALAINERGWAAGWSGRADGSASEAVLWRGGEPIALGTLPGTNTSRALGLNDAGQVVGWAEDGDERRAFLWQDGRLYDLNELLEIAGNWHLEEAAAINEQGAIIGTGLRDGLQRAYLLLPLEVADRS